MNRAARIRQAQERQRAKARFIVETAIAEGVHIGVVGPSVFVRAPGAPSPQLQLDCERSFKRAVCWNLREIRRIGGAEPKGVA